MSASREEMVCDELVELVTAYLEGTLPAADRERLEQHLEECTWCVDYVDQHREVVAALGRLDEGPGDERAWQGLLAALRDRRGDPPAPAEHADAVADARAALAASPGPPLGPLPAAFTTTREAMHRIAEEMLKPRRELETGNEIALRYTTGGFGTPPWEHGLASGTSGQLRVEGLDLVATDGDEVRRERLTDPGLDEDAAAALAAWFAFGTAALADLIALHGDLDPAPIRLWPEHFDVATDFGSEDAGTRATYGASPGDEHHPEPYLYVGPWSAPATEAGWNATGFSGAELTHAELLASADQLEAAAAFFADRLAALGG
jgi:putative zinc finger protein